jgi:hypothetical protein
MTPLTQPQYDNLLDIITLVAEHDRPSENTEARLVERSGKNPETVAWCLDVLFNEGGGWLDDDPHPQTGERGYTVNKRFNSGTLDDLYQSWSSVPERVGKMSLTHDVDEPDPDDVWNDGIYED